MIKMRHLLSENITDAPEFKRWFRKSKVIDDDGNPLVVYHGTWADEDFVKFFPLSHFGTVGQAHYRIGGSTHRSDSKYRSSSRIIPCYLRIEQPMELGDCFKSDDSHWGDMIWEIERSLGYYDKSKLIDFKTQKFYKLHNLNFRDNRKIRKVARELIIRWLKNNGYDGFTYENDCEGDGLSYVPFESNQIKSATGNCGEFDPHEPDITKENT